MLLDDFKKAKMQAMKEKNADARAIYDVLVNKCMLLSIDFKEKGKAVSDADYINIVMKTQKELEDEREAYKKVNNLEKAASIEKQIDVCKLYIPSMLSEEEIKQEIAKLDDKSISNVMKYFKANFAGKVDMSMVSKIAKTL